MGCHPINDLGMGIDDMNALDHLEYQIHKAIEDKEKKRRSE